MDELLVKFPTVDVVPLDPGGYGGTYKLLGGQVSLDLVNTVSWPGTEREHDWFDPPANITLWALAAGLVDARVRRRLDRQMRADPGRFARHASAVARIRRTLRSAIAPRARGERPSEGAVRELNQLLAEACRRRQVDPKTVEWTWLAPSTIEEAMAPAIHNAGEVLTRVDPGRLRYCPSCDWLFEDTTRNASRRWCDMADCGSRDKARRYYHRHKPTR